MITLETGSQKERQMDRQTDRQTHTHKHTHTHTHAHAHVCTHTHTRAHTHTPTSKKSNFKKPGVCWLGTSGLKIWHAIPSYLLLLTVICTCY